MRRMFKYRGGLYIGVVLISPWLFEYQSDINIEMVYISRWFKNRSGKNIEVVQISR